MKLSLNHELNMLVIFPQYTSKYTFSPNTQKMTPLLPLACIPQLAHIILFTLFQHFILYSLLRKYKFFTSAYEKL